MRIRVLEINEQIKHPDNPYRDRDAGAGQHYVGLLVAGCILDSAPRPRYGISGLPWVLRDKSAGQYPFEFSSWPLPLYPDGSGVFVRGECWQGWMLFPVPDGTRITDARYSPDAGDPVTWDVAGSA